VQGKVVTGTRAKVRKTWDAIGRNKEEVSGSIAAGLSLTSALLYDMTCITLMGARDVKADHSGLCMGSGTKRNRL
jgi:hypothetical protein